MTGMGTQLMANRGTSAIRLKAEVFRRSFDGGYGRGTAVRGNPQTPYPLR